MAKIRGVRHGAIALVAAWLLTVAPAQAQVPDACLGDDAAAIVCVVNLSRESLGLKQLRPHRLLTAAADRYSQRMALEGFFSHVDPEGRRPYDRLVGAGYGQDGSGRRWRAGELLGQGPHELATPQIMVVAWLTSPRHRRVLTSPRFRHIGVGIAIAPGPLGPFSERRYVLYAGRR